MDSVNPGELHYFNNILPPDLSPAHRLLEILKERGYFRFIPKITENAVIYCNSLVILKDPLHEQNNWSCLVEEITIDGKPYLRLVPSIPMSVKEEWIRTGRPPRISVDWTPPISVNNFGLTNPIEKQDETKFEAAIDALKDHLSTVRVSGAVVLGYLGDRRAVEPLIASLKDPECYVRASAVTALGYLGDQRAIELISACLKDQNLVVRQAAAKALSTLGDNQ